MPTTPGGVNDTRQSGNINGKGGGKKIYAKGKGTVSKYARRRVRRVHITEGKNLLQFLRGETTFDFQKNGRQARTLGPDRSKEKNGSKT